MHTPHTTDPANLSHGLKQLLRTYNAAGLQHFHRQPTHILDEQLLAQLLPSANQPSQARIPPAISPSMHLAANNPPANSSMAAAPIANAQQAHSIKPAAPVPPTLDLPTPTGTWHLPDMDVQLRAEKLAEVDQQVKACRKCPELVCYRRQTVFGEGHLRPRVCFFGEAPGAEEDAQGRPFVGAAGKLLTDIIRAMRLMREEVYILNSLKCRPPQNRTPLPEEVDNCRPFALTQLEILQPEFIILLGSVAVRSVLQSTDSVGRLRGRFHQFHGAKVLVTYHPAYLLRTPSAKKLVWEDVQMVMRELANKEFPG